MPGWQKIKIPKCIFSDFDIYFPNMDPINVLEISVVCRRRKVVATDRKVNAVTSSAHLYLLAFAIAMLCNKAH